ncbi:MAG: sigma 54-interacting transcriptional regulator [Deltaproteobacteria bacterium]|nr:MAG: sigma 54-interacting transcriptional regulator [Deltaproteobacteria bacterium]
MKNKNPDKEQFRDTGIEPIGSVPWGTHFCQFYQTKEDLISILVPYFRSGLKDNEFCMWVTSEPLNVEDAKKALKKEVENLEEYINKDQIEILDYTQWYTKSGHFDSDEVLRGWINKEKQALEKGFAGLRLTGNTFWLEKSDWKGFTDYEEAVNSVIGQHKMLAVCTYSLDKCIGAEIIDVVANHQFALIKRGGKWELIENSKHKQTLEELKLSEERYTLAQRAANIGSWDWDIRTNDLHWSDRIEPMFGFSPGKFGATYQAFLQCVHSEDRQFVVDSVNACVEEGKDYAIEHRIVWPDGTIRWVSETGDVIRDENGKAIRMLGVVQDITEHKRADEEIRRSEQKFSTIFESIPGGILVMDRERRMLAINSVLERTFGISRAEAINMRTGEALRCIHAFETPEGCGFSDFCQNCQVRNTALEALTGNEVQRNRANVELLIDGKPQRMVMLISAAPIEYEGKKQALVILEDITELNQLRQRLKTEHSFAGIIGQDYKMQNLYDTIRELAESNVAVLIQGESGTGKELVASAIHNEGPRAGKQFVPVNCGALPDGLLESELFGHVKGAFTGAIRDKKGRFELADGGTIFLDEVGDLSPAMQVKLLRVLQTGCFERVGGEKTIKVDVRVISATNKSLDKEIAAGRFREDLYYRLCVVPITLPPLRERASDIPLLVDNFLERAAKESGQERIYLSSDAQAMLMDYNWPGNVRELQNALQFALVKCRGQIIEPEHLPNNIQHPDKFIPGRRRRRRKLESKAVSDALRQTQGNRLKAARLLGVSRATLHRFLANEKNHNPTP